MTPSKAKVGSGLTVILMALYFAAGWLWFLLDPDVSQKALFPPTGIALALMLLQGYGIAGVVFVGAFVLQVTLKTPALHSLIIALSSTIEVLLGAWLVNRFASGLKCFEKPKDVGAFALLGGGLAPLVGAAFTTREFYPGLAAQFPSHPYDWLARWLAGVASVLVLTPVVVTWCVKPREGRSQGQIQEFLVLIALLAVMAGLVFGVWDTGRAKPYLLTSLCLPFLIWVGFRFRQRETAAAVFCLSLVALWGTAPRHGDLLGGKTSQALFICQEFIVISASFALVMSAAMAQRRQLRQELQTVLMETELRVEQRTQELEKQIAQRVQAEEALTKSHAELEQRVQERTVELSRANEVLRIEISQRKQAEAERLQALARLVDSQENERARISRQLHDQMGQDLTALKLGLKILTEQGADSAAGRQQLPRLEQMADVLMRRAHGLAWELRPPALDDFGLEMALQHYITEWSEHSGVAARYDSSGMEGRRLSLRIETALYRVCQEALTNVVRHAQARQVSVLLTGSTRQVCLILEDDGRGFDVEAALRNPNVRERLGLMGMQERASLVGGSLGIESSLDRGTTVIMRVPLLGKGRGGSPDHGQTEDPAGG